MRLDNLLCDACLTRLQDWLTQNGDGVSLHDLLKALLLFGNANLENLYCDRCTDKLHAAMHKEHRRGRCAGHAKLPRLLQKLVLAPLRSSENFTPPH